MSLKNNQIRSNNIKIQHCPITSIHLFGWPADLVSIDWNKQHLMSLDETLTITNNDKTPVTIYKSMNQVGISGATLGSCSLVGTNHTNRMMGSYQALFPWLNSENFDFQTHRGNLPCCDASGNKNIWQGQLQLMAGGTKRNRFRHQGNLRVF